MNLLTIHVMVPNPVLHLLCPIAIWFVMLMFFLAVSLAAHEGLQRLQRLHQVPCSRCNFYTGQQCLKCTVHPYTAQTEAAIQCPDYTPMVEHSSVPQPRSPKSLI